MKRFAVLFLLALSLASLSGWTWWKVTADGRTAALEVRTIPRGATVLYEGKTFTGSEMSGLQPGEGEVVVRLKGYKEAHRRVTLKRGERTLLPVELEPQPGEVALSVKGPKRYDVKVGPDPVREYTEKDKLQLAPGRWRVEVKADGYETRSRWVDVPSGGKSQLAITLESEGPEPVSTPTPKPEPRPAPPPPARQATTPVYTPPPPPAYYPPPPPVYRPPVQRPRPAPPPEPAFTPIPPIEPPPAAPPPEPEFTPIP